MSGHHLSPLVSSGRFPAQLSTGPISKPPLLLGKAALSPSMRNSHFPHMLQLKPSPWPRPHFILPLIKTTNVPSIIFAWMKIIMGPCRYMGNSVCLSLHTLIFYRLIFSGIKKSKQNKNKISWHSAIKQRPVVMSLYDLLQEEIFR